VRQLPQRTCQHKPEAARDTCGDTRPEVVAEGEVLAKGVPVNWCSDPGLGNWMEDTVG
jgi:hypothetical protein